MVLVYGGKVHLCAVDWQVCRCVVLSGSTLNLGKGVLVCGSMVNCHGWTVSLEVASMWWCGVGG